MPTPQLSFTDVLRTHGLRDTRPRRLVVSALRQMKRSASAYDIQKWLTKKKQSINTVTVYRVLDAFERLGLVHRQPGTSLFFACSLPTTRGHHGFLHCTGCERIEEFHDEDLCALENKIAKKAGFQSELHVSEISGRCRECRSA